MAPTVVGKHPVDYARPSGPVLLAAVLGLIAGCQSLAGGTRQDVAIETEPAGASVLLSDGQRCTTPCRLTLPRYEVVELSAAKPGCRTAAARLTPTVGENGTLLATVYDYQLGGVYGIAPNPLSLSLVCGEQARWHPPELTPEDIALLDQFGRPAPDAVGALPSSRPRAPFGVQPRLGGGLPQ